VLVGSWGSVSRNPLAKWPNVDILFRKYMFHSQQYGTFFFNRIIPAAG